MKILLLPSLLLVAVCASSDQSDVFKSIIEIVNSSGAKWKAGDNFGKNTTLSSLKTLMGVKKDKLLGLPLRERHDFPDSDIPESFDAREKWPECQSIGHIRDQGTCGSCWAVAAAAAFTDRLCIATKGKFTKQLSSEEVLACCTHCGRGCGGGAPFQAWLYFATNGLVTGGEYKSKEGCQPYEIPACSHHHQGNLPSCESLGESKTPRCERRCTNPLYAHSFSLDHHKIMRAYVIRKDIREIQKEIMTNGPVEADYDVYEDFVTYKSGVYSHVTGDTIGGHAVKIIGWGVEDGTPYWLVVNNWNKGWGDNGLFKMIRGTNDCDFENNIAAGIPVV